MNYPADSAVLLSTLNTFWTSEPAVDTSYQLHQVSWITWRQTAVRDQLVNEQQLTRQKTKKREWIIRWHQHTSRWMTETFMWIKVWSDHLHLSPLRITGCLFSTRHSWVQRFWKWKRLPASLAVKESGCICTVPTGTGSPASTSPSLLCNQHRALTRPVCVCRYRSGAVTLMSMNLSKKPARISIHALVSSGTVEAFVLESEQPGEDGLYSRCRSIHPFISELAWTAPPVMGKVTFCHTLLMWKGFQGSQRAGEENTCSSCSMCLISSGSSCFCQSVFVEGAATVPAPGYSCVFIKSEIKVMPPGFSQLGCGDKCCIMGVVGQETSTFTVFD